MKNRVFVQALNNDGETEKVYEIIDSAKVVAGRLRTASLPFDGILSGGIYAFLYPEVQPVILSGQMYRDINQNGMYEEGIDIPVRNGIARSPDAINYIARTNSNGNYATFSWAVSNVGTCRDYRIIAIDAYSQSTQNFGATLCDPPYTAHKDFLFAALVSPTADREQPKISINMTSDQGFTSGITPLGSTMSIEIRVSDNVGVSIGQTSMGITPPDGGWQPNPALSASGTASETVNGMPREVLIYRATYQPQAAGSYTVKVTATDMAATPNSGTRTVNFVVMDQQDYPTSQPGPPKVLDGGVYPAPGAKNIMVTAQPQVFFTERVNNVDGTTVTLKAVATLVEDPSFTPHFVTGAVVTSFEAGRMKVTFIPAVNLRFSTQYEIRLSQAITDLDENSLEGNDPLGYVSTFDTKIPDVYRLGQADFDGKDIAVLGNHAYVAGGTTGWEVLNISDPSQPQVVYSKSFTNPGVWWDHRGIAVTDGMATLASGAVSGPLAILTENIVYTGGNQYGMLRIYDVSTPSTPRVVGREKLAESYSGIPGRLALKDKFAYVCTAGVGLQVVDINAAKAFMQSGKQSDGSTIVGIFDTANAGYRTPADIAILKGRIYLTTTSGHLLVLDTALPQLPAEINKLAPGPNFRASRVAVADNFNYFDEAGTPQIMDIALVSSGLGSLYVLNITDPYNIQIIGTMNGIYANDIVINAAINLAFISTGNGVIVLDIKNPGSPRIIAQINNLGASPSLFEKDGWVYVASPQDGLVILNFDPTLLKFVCTDPAYPRAVLNCRDYYPALGWRTIAIEGRDEAMKLLNDPARLYFVGELPQGVSVSSGEPGSQYSAKFVDGYAKFKVKTDPTYAGQTIPLSFRATVPTQQLINTSASNANKLGVTLRVRNNSNVNLAEVLAGEAVFTYDPAVTTGVACSNTHQGKTIGTTPDKQQLDFVQKMLNHIIVPLRTYVSQDNMINTITVDGCYSAETKEALKVLMNGGADPSLTNSSIVATKVSHHESAADATKTFDKLDSDYSGLTATDKDKVIDKEILIGVSKKATDKHPTQHDDIGILELYENDDWDEDGLSNYIEVENGIDPIIANPEYLMPANASNANISVERGSYGNYLEKQGLLNSGLRSANINKGYYYFRGQDPIDNMDNYGALRVMQLIEAVAKQWDQMYPDLYPLKKDIFVSNGAPDPSATVSHPDLDKNDDDDDGVGDNNVTNEARIGIGDISLRGGGPFYTLIDNQGNFNKNITDHKTHQNGLGFDIRYMRENNAEGRVDFTDVTGGLFDRELTNKLINILFEKGAIRVYIDAATEIDESTMPNRQIIYLNGHHHHLHADFPIDNLPVGDINLLPEADTIPADGISKTIIRIIAKDKYGFPLVLVNVTTDRGTIINGYNEGSNQNVGINANGEMIFELRSSGDQDSIATIKVTSIPNEIQESLMITFTGTNP